MEQALDDSQQKCGILSKEKYDWLKKSSKQVFDETFKVLKLPLNQAIDEVMNNQDSVNMEYDMNAKEGESETMIYLKDRDLLM